MLETVRVQITEDKFHIQDISDKNPIITKFKYCYMDAYQLFHILG